MTSAVGPAVDQILAEDRLDVAGGSVDRIYWALSDRLGSVRDVVEYDATSGETVVAASADYGAFGEVFSAAPPFDPSGGGGKWRRWFEHRTVDCVGQPSYSSQPPAPSSQLPIPNNRGLTPGG